MQHFQVFIRLILLSCVFISTQLFASELFNLQKLKLYSYTLPVPPNAKSGRWSIQSQTHIFNLDVLYNGQAVTHLEGPQELGQIEFFELPESQVNQHSYQLKIQAYAFSPLNPQDFKLTNYNQNLPDNALWQWLTELSSSWSRADKSTLTNRLQQYISSNKPLLASILNCQLLSKLATMQIKTGQFELSLSTANDMQHLATTEPACSSGIVLTINNLFALYRFDDLNTYVHNLENTKAESDLYNHFAQAQAYTHLFSGFAHYLQGSNTGDIVLKQNGITHLNQVSQILRVHPIPDLLPEFYNALATTYAQNKEYSEAAFMLENAILVKRRLHESDAISEYLNNLGMLNLWQGKLTLAQQSIRESLQFTSKEYNPIAHSIHARNLAQIYNYFGDRVTAKRYLKLSLGIAEHPRTLLELAYTSIAEQQWADAMQWLERAEGISRAQEKELLPVILAVSALTSIKQGHRQTAEHYISRAMQERQALNQPYNSTQFSLTLADAFIRLGQMDNARDCLNIAARQVTPDKNNFIYLKTLEIKVLQHQLKSVSHAERVTIEQQLTHAFEQGFNELQHTVRQLNSNYQSPFWMDKAHELIDSYMTFVLTCNQSQRLQKIYQVAEQYQASVWRRQRSYFVEKGSREAPDSQEISDLLLEKLALEVQLIGNPANHESIRRKLDNLKERYLSLNRNSEQQIPDLPVLPLNEIQQKIPEGDIALRYVKINRTYVVFVISQQSWKMYALRDDINHRLHQYEHNQQAELGLQLLDEFSANDLLPPALLANQNLQQLIIVPDGILRQISFAALRQSETTGRNATLTQRVPIIYSYSLNSYLSDISSPSDSTSGIAIFAAPNTSHNGRDSAMPNSFPALPASKTEADNIQQQFKEYSVISATGDSATREQLLSHPMRYAALFHIATHGYYDPQTPETTGLVTSPDTSSSANGFVPLSQLYNQYFANQLIVISGCDTNLGQARQSEGLNSLARVFLGQGAGSVMATLWKVPDRATAIFMQHFYRALPVNNFNPSIALQTAQREMLHSGRYKNPRYWAGFVFISANQQFESISL
ncbi:CHAT domain-containing protein [Neptunicella marina]|uniref:CHAT domain-containing protein n=1 Tax=Neptunicella marina TaxID=2125989 RepID=A0A8J6IXX1_9ALTE|nr:CHAT domain-containing protein [Neptunicella marina]MBC3767367.1 CHAT domain-containing protein [Neptunicella marina]